jgi:hypothetical protein
MGGSRWTNYRLQGADRIPLKSDEGIPEKNQKDEPRTGYCFDLRSGARTKTKNVYIYRTKLLNIVSFNRTIRKSQFESTHLQFTKKKQN